MIFKEVIEQILFESGLDKKELADELGISFLQIENLRTGVTKLPGERIRELNEFGFGVFSDCESLVKINIPEGITELPEQTFAGCKALSNIILPKNLDTIVSHAFSECESLTELVIPHSVKFIDYYAFFNCIALDKLVIPKTVETIKSNAFEGCGNLKIYCEHLSKPDDWDEDWCEKW